MGGSGQLVSFLTGSARMSLRVRNEVSWFLILLGFWILIHFRGIFFRTPKDILDPFSYSIPKVTKDMGKLVWVPFTINMVATLFSKLVAGGLVRRWTPLSPSHSLQ